MNKGKYVKQDLQGMIDGIRAGNRRILSRAITLVESSNALHRQQAEELLEQLLLDTGKSLRIGITGAPGVGKSTFIEALGTYVADKGKKLAVLAIDPSSENSGGSILGDKTRMNELSRREEVYIRPSPTGDQTGGIARRSLETMLLCEAAGFDVVFIETVGVGQNETAVARMSDMSLFLLQPGAGDDLQGIKRGIVEIADMMIVNKADGKNSDLAKRTARAYASALELFRPRDDGWHVPVETCSAQEKKGIEKIWQQVEKYGQRQKNSPQFEQMRAHQMQDWFMRELNDQLMQLIQDKSATDIRFEEMFKKVARFQLSPPQAAHQVIETLLKMDKDSSQNHRRKS